jgi:hypothetical protein
MWWPTLTFTDVRVAANGRLRRDTQQARTVQSYLADPANDVH